MCLQLKKQQVSYLGFRNQVANIRLKSKRFQNKKHCGVIY